jgi:hypothetical protein
LIGDGARQAVIFFLAAPVVVFVVGLAWLLTGFHTLLLLLPGLTVMPVFSIIPSCQGKGMPLCQPIDSAKAASRGLIMYLILMITAGLAFLTSMAWKDGWFWQFEAGLIVVCAVLYALMSRSAAKQGWLSAE